MPREILTPRERLRLTLEGKEVDRPPVSFWYRFGLQHMKGESLAAACIGMAKRYKLDLLIVPFCYQYPLPPQLQPGYPEDLALLEPLTGTEGGWKEQLYAIEEISRHLGNKLPIIQVIPSPWDILLYFLKPEFINFIIMNHPGFLKHALESITTSLQNFIQRVLMAGAEGILYRITGATYKHFTPGKYKRWFYHLDNKILTTKPLKLIILQTDQKRLHFKQLITYPAHILSWPWPRTGPGIKRAQKLWKKPIAGGLDEATLPLIGVGELEAQLDKLISIPKLILMPTGPIDPTIRTSILTSIVTILDQKARKRRSA